MLTSQRLFFLMWTLIVFVSVHDGYWVLVNRLVMLGVEQNPVGRWLIQRNAGDVWLFLAAKSIGTLLVSSFLLWLYARHPRLGWTACAALCLFQLALLAFLYK
jgi:hypothetical protein